VKLLLDRGACIEAKNNDGDTPLIIACSGGHFEIVKLLLEQGAQIEESCFSSISDDNRSEMIPLLESFQRWRSRRNFLIFISIISISHSQFPHETCELLLSNDGENMNMNMPTPTPVLSHQQIPMRVTVMNMNIEEMKREVSDYL